MRIAIAAICAACGCDSVFGLKPVPDAPPSPAGDEDGDGVSQDIDNCPGVANPARKIPTATASATRAIRIRR